MTPTAVIVAWLEEVHAFGSLIDYARWLEGQPPTYRPFRRMVLQVEAAARSRGRGRTAAERDAAVASARRELDVRLALVVELNEAAAFELHDASLEVAGLAATAAHVLTGLDPAAGPELAERFRGLRRRLPGAIASWTVTLLASQVARRRLERRFLGGHESLFADLVGQEKELLDDAWQLVEAAREVAREVAAERPGTRTRGNFSLRTLGTEAFEAQARSAASAIADARIKRARAIALGTLGL